VVGPGDPGVRYVKTASFASLTVDDPAAGQWSYEIRANRLEPAGEDIRITVDQGNGQGRAERRDE
jgi:hypothetical protein